MRKTGKMRKCFSKIKKTKKKLTWQGVIIQVNPRVSLFCVSRNRWLYSIHGAHLCSAHICTHTHSQCQIGDEGKVNWLIRAGRERIVVVRWMFHRLLARQNDQRKSSFFFHYVAHSWCNGQHPYKRTSPPPPLENKNGGLFIARLSLHNHNQGIERERDGLLKNSVIFHQAFRRGRRFNSMTKQQLSQKGVVDGLDVVFVVHIQAST